MQHLIILQHKLSERLHLLDDDILNLALYPFASFFHPKMFWIAVVLMTMLSHYNAIFIFCYLLASAFGLFCTYFMKIFFQRPRPLLKSNLSKSHSFRTNEANFSMPSGDAIQSGLFVTIMLAMGFNALSLVIFHVLVCLARVYFMCHWIADTFLGTLVGIPIGLLVVLFIQF